MPRQAINLHGLPWRALMLQCCVFFILEPVTMLQQSVDLKRQTLIALIQLKSQHIDQLVENIHNPQLVNT